MITYRSKIALVFLIGFLLVSNSLSLSSATSPVTVISDVNILDLFCNGASFSFLMNFNLSSIALDVSESFSLFLVLVNQSNYQIEAGLCFFYDLSNAYQLFWILGNPFTDFQPWYTSDSYFVNGYYLDIDFLEYPDVGNPNIFPIALAKIIANFNTTCAIDNLQDINTLYIGEFAYVIDSYTTASSTFESTESTYTSSPRTSIDTSTSTTQPGKITTGLTTFAVLTLFILSGVQSLKRKKKNN